MGGLGLNPAFAGGTSGGGAIPVGGTSGGGAIHSHIPPSLLANTSQVSFQALGNPHGDVNESSLLLGEPADLSDHDAVDLTLGTGDALQAVAEKFGSLDDLAKAAKNDPDYNTKWQKIKSWISNHYVNLICIALCLTLITLLVLFCPPAAPIGIALGALGASVLFSVAIFKSAPDTGNPHIEKKQYLSDPANLAKHNARIMERMKYYELEDPKIQYTPEDWTQWKLRSDLYRNMRQDFTYKDSIKERYKKDLPGLREHAERNDEIEEKLFKFMGYVPKKDLTGLDPKLAGGQMHKNAAKESEEKLKKIKD